MLYDHIVLIPQLYSVCCLLWKLQTDTGFSYCPFKDSRVFRPLAISGPRVPPPSFYLLGVWDSVASGTRFQGLDSMLIISALF